ncbi:hypothetical protein CSKR_105135 [Clonorchis sinensis]|uniref:Uncharacterized protein n=1 Tax=Clonorchis sinensis TaxID=79923 RepID=A0A3R7C9G4_CLOSI|nr:hypothetical protein CSKR_105135 [Clonorchis sinensis]
MNPSDLCAFHYLVNNQTLNVGEPPNQSDLFTPDAIRKAKIDRLFQKASGAKVIAFAANSSNRRSPRVSVKLMFYMNRNVIDFKKYRQLPHQPKLKGEIQWDQVKMGPS